MKKKVEKSFGSQAYNSPKKEPKTTFFEFNQNNSGGNFSFNEKLGITHIVIIEATDAQAANNKAENIGLYFDGCKKRRDCPCCGDRWYPVSGKGNTVPSVYGTPVERYKPLIHWMKGKGPEVYVHYLDGTIRGFHEST